MNQPLKGIKVLDLTQSVAGPYCTMLLGDFGAEVTKVERTEGGDDARSWGPPFWGGDGATFLALNRNKKSLALNIKHEEGQELLWDLARQSDVVVRNLRSTTLEKMGFDYESLRRDNPRLIYCSLTAYGSTGPLRQLPGYDPLMQAFGGLMSITGEPDGAPVRVGTSIMDMGTGMWATIGILGALFSRERTGEGQLVETSLYETAVSWIPYQIISYLATGEAPRRHGSGTAMLAPYEAYPTQDGHLLLAAGNNNLWERLCRTIALEELIDDLRFNTNPDRVENREALFEVLASRFQEDTTEAWAEKLREAGVPCSPIRTIDQVVAEPQTEALRLVRPVEHRRIPGYADVGVGVSWDGERPETRGVPPGLGADTRTVLRNAGRSDEQIDLLIARGVVSEDVVVAERGS
jgi:crotonobetainyl-CoA:carnitine CoA-transferase CaiB-like acyl-CoA transferase